MPMKQIEISNTPEYYDVKTSYTQRLEGLSQPFPPLPYKRVVARRYRGTGRAINNVYGLNTANYPPQYESLAIAQARNKLKDALAGESAMFMVNLLEMQQTVNTIYSLASGTTRKLVKFVANLHRMKRSRVRHLIDLGKPWSESWLELHFGLIPLAADLSNCVYILTREQRKHAEVSATISWVDDYSKYKGSSSLWIKRGSIGIGIAGPVKVDNPNVALASQLGLLPDPAIVWELVPFSFLADWFANVGQFLGQWSDLAGLDLSYLSTTRKLKSDWTTWTQYGHTAPILNLTMVKGEQFQRSVGYPAVPLVMKPFKGLSVIRGATAMSLLNLQVQKIPDLVRVLNH